MFVACTSVGYMFCCLFVITACMYVSNTIIQTSLRCNSASVITTCLYVSSKYNTASVWRICASVTAICVYDLCQCVSVILVYYISDCLTRESLLFDLN